MADKIVSVPLSRLREVLRAQGKDYDYETLRNALAGVEEQLNPKLTGKRLRIIDDLTEHRIGRPPPEPGELTTAPEISLRGPAPKPKRTGDPDMPMGGLEEEVPEVAKPDKPSEYASPPDFDITDEEAYWAMHPYLGPQTKEEKDRERFGLITGTLGGAAAGAVAGGPPGAIIGGMLGAGAAAAATQKKHPVKAGATPPEGYGAEGTVEALHRVSPEGEQFLRVGKQIEEPPAPVRPGVKTALQKDWPLGPEPQQQPGPFLFHPRETQLGLRLLGGAAQRLVSSTNAVMEELASAQGYVARNQVLRQLFGMGYDYSGFDGDRAQVFKAPTLPENVVSKMEESGILLQAQGADRIAQNVGDLLMFLAPITGASKVLGLKALAEAGMWGKVGAMAGEGALLSLASVVDLRHAARIYAGGEDALKPSDYGATILMSSLALPAGAFGGKAVTLAIEKLMKRPLGQALKKYLESSFVGAAFEGGGAAWELREGGYTDEEKQEILERATAGAIAFSLAGVISDMFEGPYRSKLNVTFDEQLAIAADFLDAVAYGVSGGRPPGGVPPVIMRRAQRAQVEALAQAMRTPLAGKPQKIDVKRLEEIFDLLEPGEVRSVVENMRLDAKGQERIRQRKEDESVVLLAQERSPEVHAETLYRMDWMTPAEKRAYEVRRRDMPQELVERISEGIPSTQDGLLRYRKDPAFQAMVDGMVETTIAEARLTGRPTRQRQAVIPAGELAGPSITRGKKPKGPKKPSKAKKAPPPPEAPEKPAEPVTQAKRAKEPLSDREQAEKARTELERRIEKEPEKAITELDKIIDDRMDTMARAEKDRGTQRAGFRKGLPRKAELQETIREERLAIRQAQVDKAQVKENIAAKAEGREPVEVTEVEVFGKAAGGAQKRPRVNPLSDKKIQERLKLKREAGDAELKDLEAFFAKEGEKLRKERLGEIPELPPEKRAAEIREMFGDEPAEVPATGFTKGATVVKQTDAGPIRYRLLEEPRPAGKGKMVARAFNEKTKQTEIDIEFEVAGAQEAAGTPLFGGKQEPAQGKPDKTSEVVAPRDPNQPDMFKASQGKRSKKTPEQSFTAGVLKAGGKSHTIDAVNRAQQMLGENATRSPELPEGMREKKTPRSRKEAKEVLNALMEDQAKIETELARQRSLKPKLPRGEQDLPLWAYLLPPGAAATALLSDDEDVQAGAAAFALLFPGGKRMRNFRRKLRGAGGATLGWAGNVLRPTPPRTRFGADVEAEITSMRTKRLKPAEIDAEITKFRDTFDVTAHDGLAMRREPWRVVHQKLTNKKKAMKMAAKMRDDTQLRHRVMSDVLPNGKKIYRVEQTTLREWGKLEPPNQNPVPVRYQLLENRPVQAAEKLFTTLGSAISRRGVAGKVLNIGLQRAIQNRRAVMGRQMYNLRALGDRLHNNIKPHQELWRRDRENLRQIMENPRFGKRAPDPRNSKVKIYATVLSWVYRGKPVEFRPGYKLTPSERADVQRILNFWNEGFAGVANRAVDIGFPFAPRLNEWSGSYGPVMFREDVFFPSIGYQISDAIGYRSKRRWAEELEHAIYTEARERKTMVPDGAGGERLITKTDVRNALQYHSKRRWQTPWYSNLKDSMERASPYLEAHRLLDVSVGIEYDIARIWKRYMGSAIMRLELAQEFGPKMERATSLIRLAQEQGYDAARLQEMFDIASGQHPRMTRENQVRLLNELSGTVSISTLGLSNLSQFVSWARTHEHTRLTNTFVPTFWHNIRAEINRNSYIPRKLRKKLGDAEIDRFLAESGAGLEAEFALAMSELRGFMPRAAGAFLRTMGMVQIDRMGRNIAAVAARSYARWTDTEWIHVNKSQNSKGIKNVHKRLKELYGESPENLKLATKLEKTEAEKAYLQAIAASTIVARAHGRTETIDLPEMVADPYGGHLFKLMTFAIRMTAESVRQTKLLMSKKTATQRMRLEWIASAAAGMGLSYEIKQARNAIMGRDAVDDPAVEQLAELQSYFGNMSGYIDFVRMALGQFGPRTRPRSLRVLTSMMGATYESGFTLMLEGVYPSFEFDTMDPLVLWGIRQVPQPWRDRYLDTERLGREAAIEEMEKEESMKPKQTRSRGPRITRDRGSGR